MAASTQRFSDRVESYVRYRPSYPAALIDSLREHSHMNSHSVIADIGSGTGILTALLLPEVGQVYAVEPNDAMRAAAERELSAHPHFHSLGTTAESTALPSQSIDLITAGQAFHWFDLPATRTEFARILRPNGQVALIWNERQTDTTPFLAAYEDLLKTKSIDYDQVNHSRIDHTAIAQFFNPGTFEEITFPYEQRFDYPGLAGRALSSSYVPNCNHPSHAAFFAALEEIFAQHAEDGEIAFRYTTRLYLGRLS